MIEVRDERPGDVVTIREVHKLAFEQDQEGNIVDALRSNKAALLSMVAITRAAQTVMGRRWTRLHRTGMWVLLLIFRQPGTRPVAMTCTPRCSDPIRDQRLVLLSCKWQWGAVFGMVLLPTLVALPGGMARRYPGRRFGETETQEALWSR